MPGVPSRASVRNMQRRNFQRDIAEGLLELLGIGRIIERLRIGAARLQRARSFGFFASGKAVKIETNRVNGDALGLHVRA